MQEAQRGCNRPAKAMSDHLEDGLRCIEFEVSSGGDAQASQMRLDLARQRADGTVANERERADQPLQTRRKLLSSPSAAGSSEQATIIGSR